MNHKVLIPKVLDPKIECQFTADQKALRQKAFIYLSDPGIYVGQFVLIDKPKPVTILLTGQSKYHGVKINSSGSNWLAFTEVKGIQECIGTFDCERMAAIIYDFFQIQIAGLEALTNFRYKKSMVLAILMQPNLSLLT